MALPQVGQAQVLSDVFADALLRYAPRSVAVLGCAGGNGFDRIAPSTTRVVGVDINPAYIAALRARFVDRIAGLELFAGDVQTEVFAFAPVDLVFAGLLFEYVDAGTVLSRIRAAMLAPDAVLVTVVQLPRASIPDVTPSVFPSLGALSATMSLVHPDALAHAAQVQGYEQADTHLAESIAGKQFQVQAFRLAAAASDRP